MLKWYML